ncbi:MAG: glycosyltransferase [Propionivibrio sp.]|uniref:glycosyltransferase n=1 Tax=Propionivibrio sp. TaxID=2212460 RepID=UPI0025E3ABCE|nr:glycosyltransferase [Propionivibrio sp.]MBL0209038.1 glycosyltransferase [Propionivibrio sp.]
MPDLAPVTVIIPCYNCSGTLWRALDSVIKQSLLPSEIILVNDASTDDTGAIIDSISQQLPECVRVVTLPFNAGPSVARNTGWDLAKSPYIAFLDADDAWHPQKLAVQSGWMDDHPEVLMSGHICVEYRQGPNNVVTDPVKVRCFSLRDMLVSNRFSTPAVMVRRELALRFPKEKSHAEDYHLWLFVTASCERICRIEVPLAWYFKPAYGASGLSAALWKMELGELNAIRSLYRSSYLSVPEWLIFSGFSWAKFLRRGIAAGMYRLGYLQMKVFVHRFFSQESFSAHSNSQRLSNQVVKSFGEEWSRFPQHVLTETERLEIFDDYFSDFPWDDLPEESRGADIGCGSGRWAAVAAPRAGWLTCVDASFAALEVARRTMAGQGNVDFRQADVKSLPFADGELDFAYSLGVLHHVPETSEALRSIARALRPGGVFLLYLYYAFDNRPPWFRMLWRITDLMRRLICHLPSVLRFVVCDIIAILVYWPLGRLAASLAKIGVQVGNFPLAYYKDKSLYVMRTDALDRFGTRLEKRFRRDQIAAMLEKAGFENVQFSDTEPFWCAVARKR